MKNLTSKWKRLLSLVLSMCLVMTMIPVGGTGATAYGAEPEQLEGAACGSTDGCTGVYHNGFCTACGGYQPAVLSQTSFYEISNAGQLYWFAEFVNGGANSRTTNGWLMKDIVVNEKVLNGDGTLVSNESSLRGWMPIGTAENPFKGQFRGNGFSISGIYCVVPEDGGGAGVFAFTHNSEITNVAILDSWFAASGETASVGSIAADSAGTNFYNCYSEASVNSAFAAGGIVGISLNDYLLQCGYAGTVTVWDNLSEVGGLLGGTRTVYGTNKMSIVSGCYNRGTVVNTYTGGSRIYYTGALVGNPSYVFLSNSYYVP